jgi:HlyD family secretion protein
MMDPMKSAARANSLDNHSGSSGPLRSSELASLRINWDAAPPPKNRSYGMLFWIPLTAALMGVAYVAGQGGFHPAPEVVLQPAVREEAAGATGRLTASGYIVSVSKALLSFKTAGRIQEIRAREGARVKKGDVIALLDDRDQRAAADRAEAALATNEAALSELEAGTRPQDLARSKDAVTEAQANFDQAERTVKRYQTLVDRGGLARQQLDSAIMTRDMVAAQLESAKQAFSMSKEGPRRETIAGQRARVLEARASLRQAKQILDDCTLRAPFDGVIIERSSEVGEMLAFAGDPRQPTGIMVVTLADLAHLEVEVDISENNLAQVREKARAEITPDAYPDSKYPGSVRMIMPRANRQKAIVQVKVTIHKPDAKLRPDMSAKVTFLGADEPATPAPPKIYVSRRAVLPRPGGAIVYQVREGIAHEVPIKVGAPQGDRVEVLEGLTGGEELVVSGLSAVSDGVKVRVRQGQG